MARQLLRESGRAKKVVDVNLVDVAGSPPSDWIGNKYRAIDNYFSSTSSMVTIWPPHGAVVKSRNPTFVYATNQDYSIAALDTNQYQFRVKVAGAADGTATVVNCPLGSSQITAWPADLAPGDYQVAFYDPSIAAWTSWRWFTVSSDAVSENIPAHNTGYALISAKARPRFKPDDLTAYSLGGAFRIAYDAMATRVGSAAALPTSAAVGSNSQLAQQELTYAADYAHLFWITGDTAYRDALVNRMFGDGSTTGMANWSFSSYGSDLALRFGGEALAIAYDACRSALTAPQNTSAVAALAKCADRLLNEPGFALCSSTFGTQGGRWPGQRALFGGHAHNTWLVASMICASLAGEDTAFSGAANSNIALNVPYALKWAGLTLRVMDPMLMDDGSYHERKGYGLSSTDFQAAMLCLGYACSFSWGNSVRTKEYARTFCRSFPSSDAFHAAPGGDDDSVQSSTDHREASAAARAGLAEYSIKLAVGSLSFTNTLASAALYGKAIDAHWLLPPTETLVDGLFISSLPTRHWTVFHTDPYNKERTSVWCGHNPDGAYNHTANTPGGWQMVSRGQSLFQHALLNDNNNQSRWSRTEGGAAETANGVLVHGTNYKCASNGFKGHNSSRRMVARRTQFKRTANIVETVEDLDLATDVSISSALCSNTAAYLYNLIAKPGAVEEIITVTVASVSGSSANAMTISGSVSGPITNIYSTGGYIDCASFSCQALGNTYVGGETFTLEIRKVSKARDFKVWFPEGVLVHGKHYVFPSARNVGYRFNTRDIRVPATATVAGDILTLTFTEGTGYPNGNNISFELSGATGGVTNFALTNGSWNGNVVGGGANVQVAGMTALGVGAGTLTGTLRCNVGPCATSTLTDPVQVNSRCRPVGDIVKAWAYPLVAPIGRVLNSSAWFSSELGFNGTVNSSADEYGGSSAQSPVYKRWHNMWTYGSLTEFFGWVGIFAPADVAITAYSQSVTGTAPNRVATVNLTINGTPYTRVYREATGDF
jgi:hypothetical protein